MIKYIIDLARPKFWAWLMVAVFMLLVSKCAHATTFTDLKFGQYQIADSQWNVSACMYTSTCQIYSTNPGTAYKIPWTSGQISWAAGDYIAFVATGNSTNPWNAIQYNSSGTQKAVMGTGHIINMGTNFFFFVGNDNNTGQLFSMTSGLSGNAGMTWTGTLNPTVAQVNALAANGSTTPLSSGQTYTAPPPGPGIVNGNFSSGNSSWTVTGQFIGYNASGGPNNHSWIYLGAGKGDVHDHLAQTLTNLTVGQKYTITFWLNNSSGMACNSCDFKVSIDGTVVGELVNTGTNGWTQYSITFTAAASSQVLSIDTYNDPAAWGLTDISIAAGTSVLGTSMSANVLCCGGSAAQFNADSTNVNRVNSFVNRTTSDSQIYITQIGSNSNISVTQTGTKNNYVYYYDVGNNNSASITQSGNNNTGVNFSYNVINGSNNILSVTQTSAGGAKGSFVNITDNNNNVSVTQADSGSHYAEIGLSGGNKSVTVNQSGSTGHMASIYLSGNPTSLSLQQSGTTQNFYSIQFNCATAGGCSPISVKQGN